MSLRLYDFQLDENGYKVRLALGALGLAHETVAVDMVPGDEQARPPLIDLNPLGSLPILVDDGLVLREAEAILAYLARRYDAAGTWLPQEPAAFGQTLMWLAFATRDLHAATLARRAALFDHPGDAQALEAQARAAFRAMEDHMTLRGLLGFAWFAGPAATVADLALFPAFALARDFGIDHEAYPALRRWSRRVRGLPGFRTMPGIPDYH
ncbi:glutathione S-transferase family protein [Methylobacterium sp. Leaf89]|uniref:glutathione S-transferase family protein n=1 Tax=Methylobacterium sp. Leaf89 TaxID=1736245 RepID=UPI0006F543F2|nr:glutathione S-transferase family protein [Methylobacterium sp. Leaf89]KQO73594.1 glutathione S-transferase [Methylobacterium sp. Leaf89]